MKKPRLEKVWALFYVFQQAIKRGCAYFDTASLVSKKIRGDYIISLLSFCRSVVSGRKKSVWQ